MTQRPTILIVDDDEDFLLIARRALQRAGVFAEVRFVDVVAREQLALTFGRRPAV